MSANRFFNLVVLMALALVAALTVREAVATSVVLSDTERAQAADAARWKAMGEYYTSVEVAQNRGQAADAARWTAMGEYYENLAKSQNLDRGQAADAARWTAMANYHTQLISATR